MVEANQRNYCPCSFLGHRSNMSPQPRALSEAQEKAQWMTGAALPEAVLKSLLQGSKSGGQVSVVNLTPYDACLERACVQFNSKNPVYNIRSLSLSTDVGVTAYCERMIAVFLMEDPGCFSGICLPLKLKYHSSSWGGITTQN